MARRKIRVLQLLEGFGLGGAEKKVWELVFHMDRSRFETVVCSIGIHEGIQEHFENLGVKVIVIRRRHQFDFTLLYRLWRMIRSERIDIIMSTLFYADMMAALVGKCAGAKGVFSWETVSSPEWLIPRRLYPYRAAVRLLDKVIAVSHATAQWLVQKRGVPADRIQVIPYGVDLDLYHDGDAKAIRKSLGIPANSPVIGMVGRFVHQKGHCYLVDAAEQVIKKIPRVQFVLIGDGPLRLEIEQHVRDKSLQKNFIFPGLRHDVPELLRCFDVFVLPSLYEGLPNVVLEAMAASKPIVATPVDGTKEVVVPGETGLLVPPRQPAPLAQALIDLIDDPQRAKKLGANGRVRVEKEFSLKTQIMQFETLFEQFTFGNDRS
jgi:glycosyltransferase involved in cell wall biosynthesis